MCRCYLLIVSCLLLLVSCKPGTPKQYIQPQKMEDILVDYHLAKAISQYADASSESNNYTQALFFESVLKKHGVTKSDFDSSLVFYYTRADRFEEICKRVSERLEEQALKLGASEGEIGKYANAKGDTANIWSDRTSYLLMPQLPFNRVDYEIFGDSVFKRGDKFLIQFMSDFMYQSGNRNGIIYFAVEYNDTTMVRNQRFYNSGLTRLEYQSRDDKDIKALKGYIYLINEDVNSAATRMLFINNFQLIRFHKKDETKDKENSMSSASVDQRPTNADDGSGDTIRNSHRQLPAELRTAPDRVAPRAHQP